MITIDDRDSAEDNSISFVSKNPVRMASEDARGTPKHYRCVEIVGRYTSEGDPRDSDLDIRG